MDLISGAALVTRLLGTALQFASQAQQAAAIVARAQQEGGRAFTDDEKARLRGLDDAAAKIEEAAIAGAALKGAATGLPGGGLTKQ